MARLGRLGFLAIAVVFHLIYSVSIFDIYFVSPIVTGMREFSVEKTEAPAQRLVLFVGDGLRADKAFQSFPDPSPANDTSPADAAVPRPLAPFLRSKVLNEGTFGVSHTRVPTESRPGHVALIAGLYEDVSAVTTGWKLNPVNFDSVFNRSRHTWSWGSPDILPMFSTGAVEGRVDVDMYGAEAEDFTQDATHLDTWVFDRVKGLFADAKTNTTLSKELGKDKTVFFLHLLGLDTTGHSYRPYSKEYLHNIKIVDEGVKEITELIESYYGDGKTAFVFTADHGMSDWGSHGDGHPDNTRTPLIAWGSGVAKPVSVKNGVAKGHEDGFSSDWGFDHIQRNDVAQADVAALMAYLAGLAYPVNSVGELPLPFIDATPTEKAEALLVNAREILEMYYVKEQEKKDTKLRYKPYADFADEEHSPERRMEAIKQLIREGKAAEAIKDTEKFMQLTLQGLRYLQTYDWLFLRTLITLGYLGWIAFATTYVIDLHVLYGKTKAERPTTQVIVASSMLVAIYAFLFIEQSPPTYYAYAIFPVVFWEEVIANRSALLKGREVLMGKMSNNEVISLTFKALAFVGLLEALVQSYHHREVYTICYLAAAFWPVFYGYDFLKSDAILSATWAVACAMMSVFTLLPVIKVEDITMILISGGLMFAVGVLYLLFEKSILTSNTTASSSSQLSQPTIDPASRIVLGVQVGLIALSMVVTRSSVASLQARLGLPLGTQIVGWLVLIGSLTVPFLHGLRPNNNYIHRLMVIFLAFSPIFIILTIQYEGLFYFAFCTLLFAWVRLEHKVYLHTTAGASSTTTSSGPSKPASIDTNGPTPKEPTSNGAINTLANPLPQLQTPTQNAFRTLTLSDLRPALFFLYLLQSAFFSTGNIASISTFSLDAVFRLIPIFDPFSQGALLVLKILVPFVILSCGLGVLNRRLGVAPSALVGAVMVLGEWGCVRFFWGVRDEGSWLDIGTSITHFLIASLFCVFVAGLEVVSEVFVRGVEFGDSPSTVVEKLQKNEAKGLNGVVKEKKGLVGQIAM